MTNIILAMSKMVTSLDSVAKKLGESNSIVPTFVTSKKNVSCAGGVIVQANLNEEVKNKFLEQFELLINLISNEYKVEINRKEI
jgi:hypothetical protein